MNYNINGILLIMAISKLDEDIGDRPNYAQYLLRFIQNLIFGLNDVNIFLEINNII
jgi:hypothetical protein